MGVTTLLSCGRSLCKRATAMNDGDPEPAPRRRLDIAHDSGEVPSGLDNAPGCLPSSPRELPVPHPKLGAHSRADYGV
jgi:hypothetical protein